MLAWLPGKHRAQRQVQLETKAVDLVARLNHGTRSAHAICDAVANALEASLIVVERLPNDFVVVAGSPWKPTLQPLDRVALDSCFRTGDMAGNGSRFSAGSDWLFVPICVQGRVVAAFGLAGRFFRRRFDTANDGVISAVRSALQTTYSAEGGSKATR